LRHCFHSRWSCSKRWSDRDQPP